MQREPLLAEDRLAYIRSLRQDFEVSEEITNDIIKLKPKNFLLFQMMVDDLKQVFTLNNNMLSDALQKITSKVPKVAESTIAVLARTETHNKYQVGEMFTFFTARSTCRIPDFPNSFTPGYSSTDNEHPDVLVKKIIPTDVKTLAYLPTEARHEAKLCHLLGRQSFLLQFNISTLGISLPAVIMPYHSGITMQKFESLTEVAKLATPPKVLLKCYINFLFELNQLHQRNRTHRDLHFGNLILNTQQQKLILIDFGLSCKARDNAHIRHDVHRAGWVLPGLFRQLSELLPPDTPLPDHRLNPIQMKAIQDLFEAMNSKESKRACTSKQALEYCEKLWEHFDRLDEETLNIIQRETINRSEAMIEDVLRGSLRSLLFQKQKSTGEDTVEKRMKIKMI